MSNKKIVGLVFFSSLIFALIAQTIHSLSSFIFMEFYKNPDYYYVWSKIMMPHPGPPPSSFFVFAFGFSFVTGVLFSVVYRIIKAGITANNSVNKGLIFGLILFMVGTVPSHLALILLINLPIVIIIVWVIEGLIINILGGIAIAKINR